MKTKKVVFYDENYRGFFKAHAEKIKEYLTEREFKEANASDLEEWMKKAISEDTHKTCVVFANDEIPPTICGADSANVLIRKYLEEGGRVIWIGNIPFWVIRRGKIEKKWRIGLPQQVLGVYPLFTEVSEKVRFTKYGENLLTEKWQGNRPIAVNEKGKTLLDTPKPFSYIKILAYSNTKLLESDWNICQFH